MKKIFALLFALILLFSLFPPSVRAADAVINTSDTYDISAFDDGATVTINGGLTVTLTNTTNISDKDISILCAGANTHITINSISIYSFSGAAIDFNGAGNTLTLVGSSELHGEYNEPGIGVKAGTELTIDGAGSATVYAGSSAAGIGGSYINDDGGTINIIGGTIIAYGNRGAGIGGGQEGEGGEINISGGSVTVYGRYGGAGIGGGRFGGSGKINISGGNITAYYDVGSAGNCGACIGTGYNSYGGEITISGGVVEASHVGNTGEYFFDGGAGIGGGRYSGGITITISGGTVTACGGENASGIGSGQSADGCDITISGGTVFAEGDGGQDIGKGAYASETSTFLISGDARVLFKNDNFKTPVTTHYYFIMSPAAYIEDITLPAGWTQASGYCNEGYKNLYGTSVTYVSNGAAGAVPNAQLILRLSNHEFTARDKGALTYSGHYFTKWNTAQDGSGSDYLSGETYTAESDLTLYANWGEYPTVTYAANGASGTAPANDIITDLSNLTFIASGEGDLYRSNYHFIKWNTANDGSGSDCFPGLTYTVSDDITLYAIWNKYVSSISLDNGSLLLEENESAQLTASVSPSDAQSPVYWASSDTTVATVSQSGNVTGTGEGTCTVTASSDGKSDTCSVTVSKLPVTNVGLNYGFKNMYVDEWFVLKATVSPSGASNPEVTWQSSDTSVATVTNGVVEAVGSGSCTITATADGAYAECPVSVGTKAVTGVSLDYSSQQMYEGGIFALTATVTPADAADPTVTWESSDSSVAAVNKNGIVTAVGEGSATITATADEVNDTCKVTVLPEPKVEVASVNIFNQSGFAAILYVGDTLSLSAQVSPTDATYSSITWSSSDAAVATVASSGQVTAKSEGSAAITATAGDKTATYSITVKVHEDSEAPSTPTPAPAETPIPVIETVTDTVVREAIVKVTLDTTILPEGTKYIKLPNGEIIELTGEETMSITVPEDSVNGNGTIEIIALDDDQVPLGSVEAEAEDMPQKTYLLNVLLGILAGLATGIAGTIVALRIIITRKKG